ncbi:MAG: hypothetical protein ACYTGH_05770 [Planctomycetota bacterium]
MKPAGVVVIALLAAVIGGMVGGLAATPKEKPLPTQFDTLTVKNLTVETVGAGTVKAGKVDFGELVSRDKDKTLFRALNGVVETTGLVRCASAVVGHWVKVPTILTRDMQVVTNPLVADVKELKMYGRVAATSAGGAVSMRNAKGAFVPGKGAAKEGMMMYMGYDSSETPILYTVEMGEKPQKVLIYYPSLLKKKQAAKAK